MVIIVPVNPLPSIPFPPHPILSRTLPQQEPILALLLYISRAKPYFTTSLSLSTRTSHHPDTQEWTNIAKRGLYTAHVYTSELPSLA